MNTLDELKKKAPTSKLESSFAVDETGEVTKGWAEAVSATFVFADGETVTVSRDVLRDPDFDSVKFLT